MPNRTEACPATAVLRNATGRLPTLRLFSTPLKTPLPFEDLVAARKWQTLTDRRITYVGTNRLDSLHC
jgi:hypothetical protein